MTKQSEVAFEWYPYANKTPIRNLHKSALNGKRVFLRVNYDIVWDARVIDDRRIGLPSWTFATSLTCPPLLVPPLKLEFRIIQTVVT